MERVGKEWKIRPKGWNKIVEGSPKKALHLVDSRSETARAAASALEADGCVVASLDPTDAAAEATVRQALEALA